MYTWAIEFSTLKQQYKKWILLQSKSLTSAVAEMEMKLSTRGMLTTYDSPEYEGKAGGAMLFNKDHVVHARVLFRRVDKNEIEEDYDIIEEILKEPAIDITPEEYRNGK